ncbi:MAG: phenylacetate--CoA ligase, partial [Clostridiales bacterium]|nr:phenylacetate--CoA ligase [Clostridiales bacterium]
MFWNQRVETMDREELRALQLKRLQTTMRRVYERVPFYRDRMDGIGMRPEDI